MSVGREASGWDRALSAEDARAYLDTPITESEREDVLTLVRWFVRRYPTADERLAYARRAYGRWQRTAVRAATARRTERKPPQT
jgi:hypothetical protein